MKVAIYCRVSTEGQEQEGTSLQTQLEACLGYCKAKGYEVVCKFSEAWSGLSLERPKLSELREIVRTGQIDAVVFYSLDRLSRDPVHGVILMQEFEKNKVRLEAVAENVDNSEVGKLVFYIKGYAAKLDAERRRDATGRGKKALLKDGKLPQGNGIGIYGYKWDKDTKQRVIFDHEAEVAKKIFRMVADGNGCFRVAQMLNEASVPSKAGKKWQARTVSRIVNNSAYCGMTYFGKTKTVNGKQETVPSDKWLLLPDATPAIISKELFEQTQVVMQKFRELHPGKAKHDYPLTGFAVCRYCGSPLVGSCLRGNYRYYHCRGTRPTASREKICNARYIKADWLESTVWDKVKNILKDPGILMEEMQKRTEEGKEQLSSGVLDKEIKTLERRMKSYPGQERRLMNALRMKLATNDIILDELNQMKKEREEDLSKLNSLLQTRDNITKNTEMEEHLKELCSRVIDNLDNCTCWEKKNAYTYLDLKVTASPDSIDIKGYVAPNVLTIVRTSAL